jgi:hypothetical protein
MINLQFVDKWTTNAHFQTRWMPTPLIFHTKQFINHEKPRLKISKMRPIKGRSKKLLH